MLNDTTAEIELRTLLQKYFKAKVSNFSFINFNVDAIIS